MPTRPIEGRCRRCREQFSILELLDDRSGECPRCRLPLSPGWTLLLVEDVENVDRLQRALVAALRRLNELPGNLELVPDSLLTNLLQEVPWERDLAGNPPLAAEQIRRLRYELDSWERFDERDREAVSQGLHVLAVLLRRVGGSLDARQKTDAEQAGEAETAIVVPHGRGARRAAARLDAAADAVKGDGAHREEVLGSVNEAEAVIEETSK